MGRISKCWVMVLLAVNVLLLVNCTYSGKRMYQNLLNLHPTQEEIIEISEETKEEYEFFGIWRIEEVVLTSEMYTGTTKDGDLEENLYDPEDYIGYDVEYLFNSFRLGNHTYDNPVYTVNYMSVDDLQNGGDFHLPDLYELIEEKQIKVNMLDEYDDLSETLLLCFNITFAEDAEYDRYSFIPIGTQCVLLNNDTMLIGLWGKILLARKV